LDGRDGGDGDLFLAEAGFDVGGYGGDEDEFGNHFEGSKVRIYG
jgi:hypothetical protein